MVFLLIIILFTIITILYIFLIKIYSTGFRKIEEFNCLSKNQKTKISVIIPVRNEEKNILSTIKCIENQKYPTDLFEVIIIDDNSDDNSFNIVSEYIKTKKNIHLFKNSKNDTSKKSAIEKGVKHSSGELIITTDADCFAGEKWLVTIANFYEKYHPKMIVSPVCFYKDKGFFKKFQTFEFFSLIASGAGSVKIKKPIMCNGANLAYQKLAFSEVNGFADNKKYVSGDDVFLLQKIAKKYSASSIKFLKNYEAVVSTEAEKTLKGFINQRLRWTSKTKAHINLWIVFNAVVVYLFNFIILAALVSGFFFKDFFIITFLLFLIKLIVDFPILYNTSVFFKKSKLLWLYLPFQLIYSFYIVFVGLFGNFINFKWKGRKIKNKRY